MRIHVQKKDFIKKTQKWIVSQILIDVVIQNQNNMNKTAAIGCPLLDQCFVIYFFELNFKMSKNSY